MLRILTSIIGLILIAHSSLAQEEEKPTATIAEILRDTSPDGKFAMRIKYDKDLNDRMLRADNPKPKSNIFSEAITIIELVSLPDKEAAATLFNAAKDFGNYFHDITLLWSSDSKWCAFYFSFPRTGHTAVYHLSGEKFKAANKAEELTPPTKGSVRNEYISPVRWVKPGVLQLDVERVFRGDYAGDGYSAFTVRFDGKGKFQILKKIR